MSVTTVGYGDLHPGTLAGRLIAVALGICGSALVEVVTATLTPWCIQQVSEEEEGTAVRVALVEWSSEAIAENRSASGTRCHGCFISRE